MLKLQCFSPLVKNITSTQKSLLPIISSKLLCSEVKNDQSSQNTTTNKTQTTENLSKEAENVGDIELKNNKEDEKMAALSGFARAFKKFEEPEPEPEVPHTPQTFAALLRHSKLIDLGDPDGKVVTGKIFHVVNDDLYIDFGWKFHCVCSRPLKNGADYVRGATVKLRIKELELSTKFLGSEKELTILEADCTLMGLIDSPMKNVGEKTRNVHRKFA